jgi:hypothetical protein
MGCPLYPVPKQWKGYKGEPYKATSPTHAPADRQRRGKIQKVR